jgi:hypothetical protein
VPSLFTRAASVSSRACGMRASVCFQRPRPAALAFLETPSRGVLTPSNITSGALPRSRSPAMDSFHDRLVF